MAELRPELVAVTSLIAIEGFKAWREVLPPIAEVRKRSATDAGFAADMRAGELLGAAVILLGAGSVSAVTGSQYPLVLGVATVGVLLFVYEGTLARPAPASAEPAG